MHHQRRALFLSHGGGPLPLLGDDAHADMVACLKEIAAMIARPSVIIVVSAHWEAGNATVTSGVNPGLIYDYSGFPPESYEITYPCPGSPRLASSITRQLETAGINVMADSTRGFDHGLFVPLKIMYPEADIPCVQLSLIKSFDPLAHIKLGRALQGLSDPSILLIGSGFSFHNMRAFFTPATVDSKNANKSFEHWLVDTCSNKNISEEERIKRLVNWEAAPSARYCHPREEHLLPLLVCYGFAASACTKSFELQILNKESSMYLWDYAG
ncbi:DODA-type extradiol aromatic ring-opening family dioxygenase [Desulfobulbus oligotrophicus]|uniref:Dioxygenase n=1 Tax=Desulfobulbus oligotrophicus TaxID=1909699 RepID=A0A7T5VFB1_9BACT|nr:class III extradiol ring-cleavage dioxygenase [Desulfobulbus oligotrophicus]QQG66870.1 dioxygenase [Desulfobulbus oligotrophicus]